MYIEATVDNGRQNFKVKQAENVQNSLYGLMPSDLEFFWLSCCFRVLYRFEKFICIYLLIYFWKTIEIFLLLQVYYISDKINRNIIKRYSFCILF